MKKYILVFVCVMLLGCRMNTTDLKNETSETNETKEIKELLIEETRIFSQPYYGETKIDGKYYCGMVDIEPIFHGIYYFAHYLDDQKTIRILYYFYEHGRENPQNGSYHLVRQSDYRNGKLIKTTEISNKKVYKNKLGEYEQKLFSSVKNIKRIN